MISHQLQIPFSPRIVKENAMTSYISYPLCSVLFIIVIEKIIKTIWIYKTSHLCLIEVDFSKKLKHFYQNEPGSWQDNLLASMHPVICVVILLG